MGIVTIFFCHQRKSAYDVRHTQGGHEVTFAGAESCLGLKEYMIMILMELSGLITIELRIMCCNATRHMAVKGDELVISASYLA